MCASTRVFLVFLLIMAVAMSSCGGSAGPKNPPPGSSLPNGSLAQAENPTPMIISGGDDSSGGAPPGGTTLPFKPVCFLNTGTIAATVMAWSYIPLNTDSPAIPSDASTVAFPGGNPSACLSLPMGTYTWCYHWELGDLDGDSYIDYAHAFDERPVLLDESDFDSLDLAEKVSLSVPPGLREYPGQCDMGGRSALDIRPYIIDSRHIDNYLLGYTKIGLAHLDDYVTLAGPITVEYYYQHSETGSPPYTIDPSVRVVIPAGETYQFYLYEWTSEHWGDWNLYITIISIDG